jgi:hypothetical protein
MRSCASVALGYSFISRSKVCLTSLVASDILPVIVVLAAGDTFVDAARLPYVAPRVRVAALWYPLKSGRLKVKSVLRLPGRAPPGGVITCEAALPSSALIRRRGGGFSVKRRNTRGSIRLDRRRIDRVAVSWFGVGFGPLAFLAGLFLRCAGSLGACANAVHSVRYVRKTLWCVGFTPNGKALLRPLAKRSSQRAASRGSCSYTTNIAVTAATARLADKSSGGWRSASHSRTSRYGCFMITSDASPEHVESALVSFCSPGVRELQPGDDIVAIEWFTLCSIVALQSISASTSSQTNDHQERNPAEISTSSSSGIDDCGETVRRHG